MIFCLLSQCAMIESVASASGMVRKPLKRFSSISASSVPRLKLWAKQECFGLKSGKKI